MTESSLRKVTKVAVPLILFLALSSSLCARNEILGELKFVPKSGVEKSSGVWVDGQYVGYLGELHGSKKILLLSGEHQIRVRQAGYLDFVKTISLEPGERKEVYVVMEEDRQARYPTLTAEVKTAVLPSRAAVFVDGTFVGHAHDFDGIGHGMLIAPGKHRIKFMLPGYMTSETEVDLLPGQTFKLRTDLLEASFAEARPPMKEK